MYNENPFRFHRIEDPFVIAEYGVATGYASIQTLCTVIELVKNLSPSLPINIFLNDLPSNHHEIAYNTVWSGL